MSRAPDLDGLTALVAAEEPCPREDVVIRTDGPFFVATVAGRTRRFIWVISSFHDLGSTPPKSS